MCSSPFEAALTDKNIKGKLSDHLQVYLSHADRGGTSSRKQLANNTIIIIILLSLRVFFLPSLVGLAIKGRPVFHFLQQNISSLLLL
jgi:hypothetical protein